MKFKLTTTYSLCITISSELADVPSTLLMKKSECHGDNYALSTTYYPNIISIFNILIYAGKTGA